MFSALKRLTSQKIENVSGNTCHQPMSQNLQKKFSKGVQYNMKIVIKGDRSTGKSCLFERLQGKKFIQEYVPTDQIQVASIQWNYEGSEDIVKVEVWDIVDKAKKKPTIEGLKLTSEELQPALDAEFLDVYKGTHGVILMLDVTKKWTFDYVVKELEKIPNHIPVVVVGNHCDMSHHRTVNQEEISYFIESTQRSKPNLVLRYTEASMSNGFGLKYLHKFFCVPFLHLQRETLICQLQKNANAIAKTINELDDYQRESDYNVFLESLSKRRREVADSSGVSLPNVIKSGGNPPSIIVGQGKPIKDTEKKAMNSSFSNIKGTLLDNAGEQRRLSTSSCELPEDTIENNYTRSSPILKIPPDREISCPELNNLSNRDIIGKKNPSSSSIDQISSKNINLTSIIPSDSDKNYQGQDQNQYNTKCTEESSLYPSVISVDEFIPDGGHIDSSFLEDMSSVNINSNLENTAIHDLEDDSDPETSKNPMVTRYEEDIDPDDIQILNPVVLSKSSEEFKNSKENINMDTDRKLKKSDRLGGRESPDGLENCPLDNIGITKKKKDKLKHSSNKSKTKIGKDTETIFKSEIAEELLNKSEKSKKDTVVSPEKHSKETSSKTEKKKKKKKDRDL